MIIQVRVKLGSSPTGIEFRDGVYFVKLTATPEKGRANEQLIRLLAKFFGVPKLDIAIFKGLKSKNKTIKINSK